MKQGIYEILENTRIAANTMKMVLAGDTSALTAPGQFVLAAHQFDDVFQSQSELFRE